MWTREPGQYPNGQSNREIQLFSSVSSSTRTKCYCSFIQHGLSHYQIRIANS